MSIPALQIQTDPREAAAFGQLRAAAGMYLDPRQIAELTTAYELGRDAHGPQTRLSGEPYICHPLAVALILAEMRLDLQALVAAVLHDVIEDTCWTKDQLRERFGEEIANLVDGVTKLGRLDGRSKAEERAENVRKMFIATARDLRVVLIKLADRLHNMRTLEAMPSTRRRPIAQETLDIYAPIANRLGMSQLCRELEDLGFKSLYPLRYRVLRREVSHFQHDHSEIVGTMEAAICKRCEEKGLECEITGREKHIYSLYKKLRGKGLQLRGLKDLRGAIDFYGVRIITDSVDSCYRVLGITHSLYQPIPGRFKDYIALPKENGYQSLHTMLVGPCGVAVEVQIRSREMHQYAEKGVAAHWLYKSDDIYRKSAEAQAYQWLRDLLEIQQSADSLEFIDNLKVSLFPQEIFVFTPKGKIVKLPRSATVLDFAYAVHTDVGNACLSAQVDSILVPLHVPLESGQTVEIITGPLGRPNPLWLNYVVTVKARAAIRQFLRNFTRQDAVALGQRLLERELHGLGKKWTDLSPERIATLLEVLNAPNEEQLFEDIGFGNRMPFLIAKRLCQDDVRAGIKLDGLETDSATPLIIRGTEGMVVSLAKCCHPIPGDEIVGFFHPGKGIVVHQRDCHNSLETLKKEGHWLALEWDEDVTGEFSVEIRVELKDRPGALATMAATISGAGCNIESIDVKKQDTQSAVDYITLSVKNRVHLAQLMRRLRKLEVVTKLYRIKSG